MYVVVMNCSSECAYGYYHYVGIVIGVCVCVTSQKGYTIIMSVTVVVARGVVG